MHSCTELIPIVYMLRNVPLELELQNRPGIFHYLAGEIQGVVDTLHEGEACEWCLRQYLQVVPHIFIRVVIVLRPQIRIRIVTTHGTWNTKTYVCNHRAPDVHLTGCLPDQTSKTNKPHVANLTLLHSTSSWPAMKRFGIPKLNRKKIEMQKHKRPLLRNGSRHLLPIRVPSRGSRLNWTVIDYLKRARISN